MGEVHVRLATGEVLPVQRIYHECGTLWRLYLDGGRYVWVEADSLRPGETYMPLKLPQRAA